MTDMHNKPYLHSEVVHVMTAVVVRTTMPTLPAAHMWQQPRSSSPRHHVAGVRCVDKIPTILFQMVEAVWRQNGQHDVGLEMFWFNQG